MRKHDPWLRIIGVFKLFKAAALVAFALSLLDDNLRHHMRGIARAVGVDPDHYLADAIAMLRSLNRPHRLEIGLAVMMYASLFTVEGIGLILRRVWAEYVTVIITTSFIPVEIYELVVKKSWLKGAVVAVNVAAIIYLLWRLRRDHHWPWRLPTT
jgi:uncharacterized membrane protein (DUF2068 family)